ncbi:MAG: hypothetical protein K6G36_00005 [Candidatus Saccharibacteria bacterium]|nr:hypothetical protein [Candidatus Saccharibacteria bacterium]
MIIMNNGSVGKSVVISGVNNKNIVISREGVFIDGERVTNSEEDSGIVIHGNCKDVRVECACRVEIKGDIEGSLSVAGDVLVEGDVVGNVQAGKEVTCKTISGSASARGSIVCGSIGGDALAGEGVVTG